jgi:hypothetical protein
MPDNMSQAIIRDNRGEQQPTDKAATFGDLSCMAHLLAAMEVWRFRNRALGLAVLMHIRIILPQVRRARAYASRLICRGAYG